jgi:hypothetical protein
LDPITEPDVEAAWSEEIERRLAEIDAGTVKLIPWDDVRSNCSASLNGKNNDPRSETIETLEATALAV